MTYCIGLMSGTSMDGIDAVLARFDAQGRPTVINHHSIELPEPLLSQLHTLCSPGSDEIDLMGRADRALGYRFAEAVKALLKTSGLEAEAIAAIGSHGQTVRHHPDGRHAFTLQLGCPNTLAIETGIDVIADFRRKDIALGGQGAPLVPAFHHHLFASETPRLIVNVGGIANLTFLDPNGPILGYDTGPGNTLMDAWAREHFGQPYDRDGAIAASGSVDDALLTRLLGHAYFAQPAPKSTGRELFNLNWLYSHLNSLDPLPHEDVMATLLATTVLSIADCAQSLAPSGELYLCGGGAFNGELARQLAQRLPSYRIDTTATLGLDPQLVESVAFAWLAWRHLQGLPGNLPAVTGASREAILGGRYPAA
ncbi:anhydro-N-acetylmuramic acid kinase [Ferrimonas gelatinilytica]|uniref:Anhydro-N-acetylmuramic acid kinase n=1 Tax=Ferrimonas gelatinilytica TaxID=1255257 RepID=A0ABP9S6V2_9GAMM